MFKQDDLTVRQKWTVASFNKFYGKMWVGFCFNTGKRFLVDVLF